MLEVSRTGNTSTAIEVNYFTMGGTATPDVDYKSVSGKLSFAAGEMIKYVEVPIIDDLEPEDTEYFTVHLTLSNDGKDSDAESEMVHLSPIAICEVAILDDDVPGVFEVHKKSYSIKSSEDAVNIQIVRKEGCLGTVSVKYKTIQGTAKGGEDYMEMSGELKFLQGETTKSVSIPILNGLRYEEDEEFYICIAEPTNGAKLGLCTKATILIESDFETRQKINGLFAQIQAMSVHALIKDDWFNQFVEAITPPEVIFIFPCESFNLKNGLILVNSFFRTRRAVASLCIF